MPPQRRARESGGGRRITNVATLLRASFVARVPRVRRHFRRLLCHAPAKARPRRRPAVKARPCPRPAVQADRPVRAGPCDHAVRHAARRACTGRDERYVRRCTRGQAGNRACTHVSCTASPANQRRSRNGSASALRAHSPPGDAAENAAVRRTHATRWNKEPWVLGASSRYYRGWRASRARTPPLPPLPAQRDQPLGRQPHRRSKGSIQTRWGAAPRCAGSLPSRTTNHRSRGRADCLRIRWLRDRNCPG